VLEIAQALGVKERTVYYYLKVSTAQPLTM
jgi:hypothetical protein